MGPGPGSAGAPGRGQQDYKVPMCSSKVVTTSLPVESWENCAAAEEKKKGKTKSEQIHKYGDSTGTVALMRPRGASK